MINLRETLAFGRSRGTWKKVLRALYRNRAGGTGHPGTRLREITGFGSNPGNLRMFAYRPPTLADKPALVVVLHGCTQTAAGYDLGTGWSTLAERFGFALLLPEQQRLNNPSGCFNWFQSEDIKRGHGEAASIRQMVMTMVSNHGIDPARVFVTGLSAGGAMTSVMLATYPDVFAGGAIIAGLPYGAATNVQQAFETMRQCPPRPARAWGDLVRSASRHKGPWPRVSVWHGDADGTVIPSNAGEIIKQWADMHGLPIQPSSEAKVDGYPRQVWVDGGGDEVIESYTIPRMAHGTPLATGAADDQCGAVGPFLLEVGISSSYHIARFFGVASAQGAAAGRSQRPVAITVAHVIDETDRATAPAEPVDAEMIEPDAWRGSQQPALDIGAVITKALRTA